jgi:hypothetical protein
MCRGVSTCVGGGVIHMCRGFVVNALGVAAQEQGPCPHASVGEDPGSIISSADLST